MKARLAVKRGEWKGLQPLLTALLALCCYAVGRWQGEVQHVAGGLGALLAGGGAPGSNGSAEARAAAALLPATCPPAHVDFGYDVVAATAAAPPLKSFQPPMRREGFTPEFNSNAELYDKMWTGNHTYQKASCWGCRFVMDVVGRLDFSTVLDAGTGNGQIVRVMRMRGKAAWGVELSKAVLERDAPDLLQAGLVEQGSLTNLPYQNSQFDLVFSADVLEHIRPEEADAVVRELVRVARRHIVVSISLKSFQNEKLHTMLRPRAWWEAKFAQYGAAVNRPMVWALQNKETRFSRARGEYKACRMEGSETDGGKYEVCVVDQTWLVGRPGQEMRTIRCITPANAELEPWIFAFTVDK